MAWQQLALHYLELPSDPQVWTMQDENAAQLLDVMSYWLNVEYTKWTTDPDEAREAAASGARVKQPPFPIIEPVAHRPPAVHAAAVARYEAQLSRWQESNEPDRPEASTARDMLAQFATSPNVRTFPKGGE